MKIAVFLPQPWRGGMLRAFRSFCEHLASCAADEGRAVEIVMSILPDTYEPEEIDTDAPNVSIRETEWVHVGEEEQEFLGLSKDKDFVSMVRPTDRGRDFLDCDCWIVFGAYFPIVGRLAPLRPYVVYAPDFIQRYVPGIYDNVQDWGSQGWMTNINLILTLRGAEGVLVTTPKTGLDAVGYAGVPRERVTLMPLWSLDMSDIEPKSDGVPDKDYILWISNTTAHKNHENALDAVEEYYANCGGELDVILIGPYTDRFSTPWLRRAKKANSYIHPYWECVNQRIDSSIHTRKHLSILGEVGDERYVSLIAQAKFVWHNVLYDNGSFVALETARLGTPLLSSDYPQMRYICETFGIAATYFPAAEPKEAARALRRMEEGADGLRSQVRLVLPERWDTGLREAFRNLLSELESFDRGSAAAAVRGDFQPRTPRASDPSGYAADPAVLRTSKPGG